MRSRHCGTAEVAILAATGESFFFSSYLIRLFFQSQFAVELTRSDMGLRAPELNNLNTPSYFFFFLKREARKTVKK